MKNRELESFIDDRVLDEGDEPPTTCTGHASFASIVDGRYSRRQIMRGGIQAAVAGFLASAAATSGCTTAAPPPPPGEAPADVPPVSLGFSPIPVYDGDEIVVPDGYTGKPFLVMGTPIVGDQAANPAAATVGAFERCSGAEMEERIGAHHDGMHYFPFPDDPNNHGLLCINHEYIDGPKMVPEGTWVSRGPRPADQVRKGVAAHGVSVVEVRRPAPGADWEVVPGRYNRRITAETPMEFMGPVRESALVVTRYSPDGTRARGTFNNCANGYTPWNTYLTCEENWAGYFAAGDDTERRENRRYGVGRASSRYGWDQADGEPSASPENPDPYSRFRVEATGERAADDYRNEANGHGWIVEIDPWDPASTPMKHTGLGRFAHEGCVFAPVRGGDPLVFYSGDDAFNQYIYKFVTREGYEDGRSSSRMLDDGTLYAATFHADGTGEWHALDLADAAFQAALDRAIADPRSVWPGGEYDDFTGFTDQADLLVNTRLAADVAGATPMDRPEWGAVHPHTGEVYFTLTNNSRRGRRDTSATSPMPARIDAANPRPANEYGHIIRWREAGGRAAATAFEWDLFVLCGPPTDSRDLDGFVLGDDAIHASPDGLWVDNQGILWIQTDMSPGQLQSQVKRLGNNAMLAANPVTGEIRRFFAGPRGQEVSGFASTPDGRTMFINVQHPGESSERIPLLASTYPDGPGGRGRSCTIVITKDDGGPIGS